MLTAEGADCSQGQASSLETSSRCS